ncbi:MAG: putative DNA binding domain-containing protein [Proteobacteria bacterium]|nr:putative DNA binding domain-containing protein [Pseudomonadota bacterium]
MDIIKLTQLPEGQTLEFKRDTSSLDAILKAVIGFANSAGGIILIGVDDDGSIVGLLEPAKVQEQVANAIAHRIKPQLLPEFNIVEVRHKSMLVIQVEHIPAPFYLTNKGEEQGVFIRLGNSTRLASKETIAEMKRASHHPYFDKAPCNNVGEKDLDMPLIQKTLANSNISINSEKLMSLGILTHRGKRVVATNGGIILFGKPDILYEYFPFAQVRCARFAGTSRAEFIDRFNVEGSILHAIDEVPKFIRRNTRMAGKFGGMQRKDIAEYPMGGIREALTNALVHANYEISGTRIFVAIYDDRLEIQNPGIMPPGMSIEQFKAGVSRIRNPVIARVFGELNLVEEWGSGYKRIREACKQGGYPEPQWEELGTVLRVTFFPHPDFAHKAPADQVGTKSGLSWDQVGTKLELTSEATLILQMCQQPKTLVELMSALYLKNRTKFRQKYLNPLIEQKLLQMTIPDKPNSRMQKYQTTTIGLELGHPKN